MLCLNYEALAFQFTGILEVCDGCVCLKAKARALRKKTYIRATNPEESIFVDTDGPFPESIIGNC